MDRIGSTQYMSKINLLKEYWQVPLTPVAKEISAIVTLEGFYQYKVMPFGMKNIPATFQWKMNQVVENFKGCDTLMISSCLAAQGNNTSSEFSQFGYAHVTYLGHIVGQGL